MKSIKRLQTGFITLPEIILVIAISAFIVMLVAVIFMSQTDLFIKQQEDIGLSINNKQALQAMADDLRQAVSVEPSTIINSQSYTTDDDTTIVFKLPSIDSSGNIIADKYDIFVYEYKVSDKQLVKLVKPDPDPASTRQNLNKIVANNIEDVQFSYDNPDYAQVKKVTVKLTAQKPNASGSTEENVEVILRNKI